ncbi:TPA: hypothetical protein ACH3X2_012856 [Trebouxia sp. C0005]
MVQACSQQCLVQEQLTIVLVPVFFPSLSPRIKVSSKAPTVFGTPFGVLSTGYLWVTARLQGIPCKSCTCGRKLVQIVMRSLPCHACQIRLCLPMCAASFETAYCTPKTHCIARACLPTPATLVSHAQHKNGIYGCANVQKELSK